MVQRPFASLACCTLLALAGCSDDSSSSVGPDPSPSVSSSEPAPSPTETEDAETPEAFVRRWVDVDREMQNSGDTKRLSCISKTAVPATGWPIKMDRSTRRGGM